MLGFFFVCFSIKVSSYMSVLICINMYIIKNFSLAGWVFTVDICFMELSSVCTMGNEICVHNEVSLINTLAQKSSVIQTLLVITNVCKQMFFSHFSLLVGIPF